MTTVSAIIPCFERKKFLGPCLDSILANDFPRENLEILVCDGMSTDGTREIIQQYSKKYQIIKLLDNLKKYRPSALNVGIKAAKGEIILIMDAHTLYEKDYISKCVNRLFEYEADNVGGVLITKPQTSGFIAEAIALSLTSPFGVGNAPHRTGCETPREADAVYYGCYRKSTFEKIGIFNENLKGNADLDFNLRLKYAGGKILLFPDIKIVYFARSTLWAFCKNNFRNGFWALYSWKFSNHLTFRVRHLIPFIFCASLITLPALGFFIHNGFFYLFCFIILSYLIINLYFSIDIAQENGKRFLLVMPFIFFLLHITHGLGSFSGILKIIFSKQFGKLKFSEFS